MKNNQATSAKRRIAAMFMAVTMLVTMFSSSITVSATQSTQNSNQGDGVILKKTATPHLDESGNPDGTVDITIDAYTTGTVVSSSTVTPMDILLVLDTSGSMAYNLNNDNTASSGNSRMDMLKKSVNSFIDQTLESNKGATTDAERHRMAIVKYAGDRYYNGNGSTLDSVDDIDSGYTVADYVGNHTYNYKYNYWNSVNSNYTQLVRNFTSVDSAGASSLKDAVNSLEPIGATAIDFGVKLAQQTMKQRTDKSRNVVVIVFTDGTPTHGSSYDGDVANAALSAAAPIKAVSGNKIYTLSVYNGADSDSLTNDNTNKFMHYLSNNYPNATSMSSIGTGSPTSGYYMTASEEEHLEEIFKTISSSIGKPEMKLGSDAVAADSLSPYFEFSKDVALESITLQTLDKTADGWAEPKTAEGVSASAGDVQRDGNSTVTVSGFDFDANYVTNTPKPNTTADYGKKLRIIINVKPDYTAIDGITPRTGEVSTNSEIGPASIISEGNVVATTLSPTVTLRKVTYKVTVGDETNPYNDGKNDVYRLAGSDYTVIKAPTMAGYSFSGWKKDGADAATFEMPDSDVEITGVFTPNEYNVTYVYDGIVPDGANPATPDGYNHKGTYGETYSVKSEPTAPVGYKFTGWRTESANITNDSKFTMPANDVTFIGSFSAEDVGYKVEHYLQDKEGNYPSEATYKEDMPGVTGIEVSETAHDYIGFTFDSDYEGNITSGTVTGDGQLVLKLYYERNRHKVSYKYSGGVTLEEMPELPGEADYYYEETANVAEEPVVPGYTFSGWSTSAKIEIDDQGNFVMGHDDVEFIGYFEVNNNTPYKIQHFRQNLDGSYETTPYRTFDSTGTTGETVSSEPIEIQGFTYNPNANGTLPEAAILGDGSLTLKFFYDRNEYEVTYKYDGDAPTGAGSAPDTIKYKYGETVNVEQNPTEVAGYTFGGWHTSDASVAEGKFTMPAKNVAFTGSWSVNTNTPYTVEHYTEALAGGWNLEADDTENFTGTTNAEAEAKPHTYKGFTYDDSKSIASGTITGDGKLTLKLYYTRNTHKVTYEYFNDVLEGGRPDLSEYGGEYKYGETVTVKDKLDKQGYTFNGWVLGTGGNVTGSFTMPDSDVVLKGWFNPNTNTPYQVNYYFEAIDSEDYILSETESHPGAGTTGELAEEKHDDDATKYPGFTFNEEKSETSGTIAADGSLVLELYYDRNEYTVSYKLTGDHELDVTVPNSETHKYGETVNIKDELTKEGYTFVGWTTDDVTFNISTKKFTMPNKNVELRGYFTPNTGTEYKIEYYLQSVDGEYLDLDAAASDYTLIDDSARKYVDTLNGTTGDTVKVAIELPAGFEHDEGHENEVLEGEIAGDGGLVLRVYYKRKQYNVSYAYIGTLIPGEAPSLEGMTKAYPFGATVTIANDIEVAGYNFNGWTTPGGAVKANDVSFVMPNQDVELQGRFTARNDTGYKIYHIGRDLDGEYTVQLSDPEIRTGVTGGKAAAEAKSFEGFTYNNNKTADEGQIGQLIKGDGSTEVKLYYDRNKHKVTYTYTGSVPEDATDITGYGGEYLFDANVEVEADATAEGYDFVGWTTPGGAVKADDETFEMPDRDIELRGSFKPRDDTKYTVCHIGADLAGDYNVKLSVENNLKGITGTQVAAQRKSFEGYTYDDTKTSELTGIIKGDGTLVLKIYYRRNIHSVSYAYANSVTGASVLPTTASAVYGSTVTVAPTASAPGYDFGGWVTDDADIAEGNFTMPDTDVVLVGTFIPRNDTKYKVKHIGQDTEGDGYNVLLLEKEMNDGKTGDTKSAKPISVTGYTYNSEKSKDTGTSVITGDGETVLILYYDKDMHTVTYTYTGTEIENAPSLPPTQSYRYEATVTVAPDPSVKGYTFVGWTSLYETVKENDTSFTMPAMDVQLRGEFRPRTDITYRVEHYVQDKNIPEHYNHLEAKDQTLPGTMNTQVIGYPITITGYVFNAEESKDTKQGIVDVDNETGAGITVLKLYYDRVEHNVAYEYIGKVPSGATPQSELTTEQYIEGESVTVKEIVVPDGYTFSGWESDGGTVNPENPETYPTFTMPNRAVHLVGSFAPKNTSYKVEHYLQINGGSNYDNTNYGSEPVATEIINTVVVSEETTRNIKVGETVVAHAKTYAGFTYDGVKSAATYSGVVGYDDGVDGAGLTLKLYYNKNPYTVHYRYSRMPKNITPEQETAMNEKLPEEHTQYAGEGVEIGDAPTDLPDGYSFAGWTSTISGSEVIDVDGVDFTMPNQDVVLIARLAAKNDTPYKVEHYIGSGDTAEGYTLYNTEDFTGTTETLVQAEPIEINGYTYYAEHSAAIKEDYINGDGSTVLMLFYKRNPSGGGGGGTSYGNIEIKKTVNAPDDLDIENMEFTFNIYKGSKQSGTVYKTVTVGANQSKSIEIPVGTYYITEADGDITGYTLNTVCSSEDNTVKVTTNKTAEVSFENTYESKEAMLEKNDHFAYIIGYPDGNVKPDAGITRAEVATIFFRMMTDEARTAYRKTENTFSDVSKSDWHNIAISTLENAQILDGYLDGTFKPDEAITRAELSKIAASFYKAQLDDSVKFSDISGHWAEDFIKSAYGYGFIDGYPDGSFKPDQAITRAETMKIVNRSLERAPHKDYLLDDMIKWPDNSDRNEWYYTDVQEATNSHNYKMSASYEVWTELRPVRDWAALENGDRDN